MRHKVLWTLVLLNVVLLTSLITRFAHDNAALAQAPGQPRRLGEVVMIPGEVTGGANAVIYVVDTGNHELGAMSFDGQNFTYMAPINLDRIFEAGAAVTGNGRGTRTGTYPR